MQCWAGERPPVWSALVTEWQRCYAPTRLVSLKWSAMGSRLKVVCCMLPPLLTLLRRGGVYTSWVWYVHSYGKDPSYQTDPQPPACYGSQITGSSRWTQRLSHWLTVGVFESKGRPVSPGGWGWSTRGMAVSGAIFSGLLSFQANPCFPRWVLLGFLGG